MRIPHGHVNVFVAEYLLQSLDATTPHYVMARECVPEVVKAEIADSRSLAGRRERPLNLFEGPSLIVTEDVFRFKALSPTGVV
jgi:hypothetical protein